MYILVGYSTGLTYKWGGENCYITRLAGSIVGCTSWDGGNLQRYSVGLVGSIIDKLDWNIHKLYRFYFIWTAYGRNRNS